MNPEQHAAVRSAVDRRMLSFEHGDWKIIYGHVDHYAA